MEDNEKQEEIKEEIVNEDIETVKLKEELENTTDRLKRLMAEFDNFKKRSSKERETLYNSVLGDVVNKLLPVLDNLEKAANAETEDTNYKQGEAGAAVKHLAKTIYGSTFSIWSKRN